MNNMKIKPLFNTNPKKEGCILQSNRWLNLGGSGAEVQL